MSSQCKARKRLLARMSCINLHFNRPPFPHLPARPGHNWQLIDDIDAPHLSFALLASGVVSVPAQHAQSDSADCPATIPYPSLESAPSQSSSVQAMQPQAVALHESLHKAASRLLAERNAASGNLQTAAHFSKSFSAPCLHEADDDPINPSSPPRIPQSTHSPDPDLPKACHPKRTVKQAIARASTPRHSVHNLPHRCNAWAATPPAKARPAARMPPPVPPAPLQVLMHPPAQRWDNNNTFKPTPLAPPTPRPAPRSLALRRAQLPPCKSTAPPRPQVPPIQQAKAPQAPRLASAPTVHSFHAVSTTRASQAQRKERALTRFIALLVIAGTASEIYTSFHNKPTFNDHSRQCIAKNSASTLDRYIKCVEHFTDYLAMWGSSMAACDWPCIADYLHSAKQSKLWDRACHQAPPTMCIKALRWFARQAQIPNLSTAMFQPLISAYLVRDGPRDRREAMLLPMACVVSWEHCICRKLGSTSLRLWLGAALLCVHASLRWGDAQRIDWSSLDLTSTALRGTCYATKTTSDGQPWAVHWRGFTGRDPSTSWVIHWLHILHGYLTENPRSKPDFMFMQCSLDGPLPALASPSSYHHSLRCLRWACAAPWLCAPPILTSTEALSLALHSLKSCLLAAAAQRELLKEHRLQHGHHRDSAALYSRDDTIASLRIQRQIRTALWQGWQPQRSQARGGQAPVPEPPFHIHTGECQPCLTQSDLQDPQLARFISRHETLPRAPPCLPQTGSSSPEPLSDNSLLQASAEDPEAAEVERAALHLQLESSSEPEGPASPVASQPSSAESEDVAELSLQGTGVRNGGWACTHCITPASWQAYRSTPPKERNVFIVKTACGVQLRRCAFLTQLSTATSLCGRAACKSARASENAGT